MTHAALIDGVLLGFLAVMIVLLIMCVIAVILAPRQGPGSHTAQQHQAAAPPPPLPSRQQPAIAPPPPLPRRQPVTARAADFQAAPTTGFHAAPAAGVKGWPAADDETTELGALQPLHERIERAEVSGGQPWGPAPKPPGVDG
jgi:hypothetical protein